MFVFPPSDVQCEHVNTDEDLTILIDYQKYQQSINARRHPRNAKHANQTKSSVCADVGKEEYQKCGKQCVLGCRYDSLVSENVTATGNCSVTSCTEGCFCKEGFIRYHNKCIPATECPTRNTRSVGLLLNGYETEYPSKLFGIFRPCASSGCKPIQSLIQRPQQSCKSLCVFS